jgi:apolipoprotein N-acyltransferase
VQQAFALSIISGLLFPLAQPNELLPLGSPLLGLVALIPLYIAFRTTPQARTAARIGAVFGTVSTVIANYWLMFFGDYSFWTIGGTTLGYAGYNFVLGGYLWVATRGDRAYRPLLFALVWTVYEYFKSIGFLGYPWGLAAYPVATVLPIAQLAAVTGVWGISALVVYFNASLGEYLSNAALWRSHKEMRNLLLSAVLLLAAFVFGTIRMQRPIEPEQHVTMLLVQQNADAWNTRDVARPLNIAQNETLSAVDEFGPPDLIVWSETALRYLFPQGRGWYESNPAELPFSQFVAELPAPLLTGAPYQSPTEESDVYNAALLFDGSIDVEEWYGKRQLVPFAESIPFYDIPAVRRFFRDAVGLFGTWAPGPEGHLFEITPSSGDPVVFATPICFEDGFAGVNRHFVGNGADLLVNLTNNSWSRTNSAQTQHFVAARFRPIETGRTLVRSTNSGYTAVVDPLGRVLASLPMFVTDSLSVEVPVYKPDVETVYQTYGDYLPLGLLAGLAAAFVVWRIRRREHGGQLLPANTAE